MPISLRLRGVLLRHTFVVGILPNTQRCYVLQLRCYRDDSAPEEPLHPNGVLPPLSPDPSDLSTLIEQMRLNPALQRELQQAQRNEAPAQWCGEMRLVFLVTPRTEAPLERFLNRHFCDHLVVIDGFAIAHNIDYSLVVRPPRPARVPRSLRFSDIGTRHCALAFRCELSSRTALPLLYRQRLPGAQCTKAHIPGPRSFA